MAGTGGGPIEADLALQTIQAKGTPAFYLPDPIPALRMPSGLRRGYQDFANTPVTASTQTAALALDLSEGAAIGAELVVNGDNEAALMSNLQGGAPSGVRGTVAQSTDQAFFGSNSAKYLCNDATSAAHYIVMGDVGANDSVRITGRVYLPTGSLGRVAVVDRNDGSFVVEIVSSTKDAWVAFTVIRPAKGSLWNLALGNNNSESKDGEAFYIDVLSIQTIAGYHFYQATSADEPTLNLTSGLYGYLGDGVSKGFDNSLAPNANPTQITAINANAVSDILTGCQVGTAKWELGLDGDGKLIANIGTSSIVVTAASIVDVPGVAAMSASGSDYFVGWYPIAGGSETDAGTFSGSIPTTQGVYSLQTNDDGSGASFADALMLRNLFQRSQWSQAEIEAVAANQWRRQLQALAA